MGFVSLIQLLRWRSHQVFHCQGKSSAEADFQAKPLPQRDLPNASGLNLSSGWGAEATDNPHGNAMENAMKNGEVVVSKMLYPKKTWCVSMWIASCIKCCIMFQRSTLFGMMIQVSHGGEWRLQGMGLRVDFLAPFSGSMLDFGTVFETVCILKVVNEQFFQVLESSAGGLTAQLAICLVDQKDNNSRSDNGILWDWCLWAPGIVYKYRWSYDGWSVVCATNK